MTADSRWRLSVHHGCYNKLKYARQSIINYIIELVELILISAFSRTELLSAQSQTYAYNIRDLYELLLMKSICEASLTLPTSASMLELSLDRHAGIYLIIFWCQAHTHVHART